MHFLQNSPIQVHGNLKSSNVLIDSRWTCKVTDHGLFLFKEGQEVDLEAGTESKYYGNLSLFGNLRTSKLIKLWYQLHLTVDGHFSTKQC